MSESRMPPKSAEDRLLEDLARTQPRAAIAKDFIDPMDAAVAGFARGGIVRNEADLQARADAAKDEHFADETREAAAWPVPPWKRAPTGVCAPSPKIGGDKKAGWDKESYPTDARNQETGKLRLDVYRLWQERDRLITESLRLLALGADPVELEPIHGTSEDMWREALAKLNNPLVRVTGNDPVEVTGNDFPVKDGKITIPTVNMPEVDPKDIPLLDSAKRRLLDEAVEGIAEGIAKYQWDKDPRGKDSNPKDAIGSRKAGLSMLPRQVLYEVGLGMLEGALKYARHNYRIAGVRASVYYDANSRHMDAWWEGQDTDPGSGLHHVVKAIASLIVLRDSMLAGNWQDDRPPSIGDPNWLDYLNKEAERIIDEFEGEPKQPFVKGDNE